LQLYSDIKATVQKKSSILFYSSYFLEKIHFGVQKKSTPVTYYISGGRSGMWADDTMLSPQ